MYDVELIDLVEDDFASIYEHLLRSYVNFGDSVEEAILRATQRIVGLKEKMSDLGRAPYQGTVLSAVRPGLRRVTKDDGIFYFDLDARRRRLRVLSVFFGVQDHMTEILDRLTRLQAQR